ncbi:CotH kinase family protein [Mycobacterium sp. ITM-2016-00317]|uniref:CotH kinase family protein n=1 Tax=Mycobacterium sp. ITM-2016-00317 TaxID=2099694 RepID=UPI00287FE7CA|nr:CotH kinase family protein [Mycobacterium sp. ITM-2016-00317]WNG86942.1 CotH kinase family protein [Mycobacterium sp. ITM-2016-00317]
MTRPTSEDVTAPVRPTGARRLVRRVPRSVRQHWKLLATLIVFAAVVGLVFGQVRLRPYITGDVSVIASQITHDIPGTVDLFDPTVEHTLSIEIADAELRHMLTQFTADGDKKWVSADLTIDGTVIDDVAVRLKGNSTLMGLRPPPPGLEGFSIPPSFGPMGAVSADVPTSLPLLISFDENADGRGYQGRTELTVRPGTSMLNEALALSLTAGTGQPTQRYAHVRYSINGDTTTKLVLEHPDDTYANTLYESAGYLYKARAGSQFKYRGSDQSIYAGEFKQINAVDSGNLQPLIDFLKWLDTADAAEFDASLPQWVDVESLARYVATQNLLVNADDMSGPGQNYYLWYDLDTRKLSVVSWDLNLAMLMGDPTTGPHDPVEMVFPSGFPPPPGPPPGAAPGEVPPWLRGNTLKKRFLESRAFTDLYETAYWELYGQMYADGRAVELLDELVATVPLSAGLSEQALRDEAESLRSWVTERAAALERIRS